jgi:hypothetical protein
MLGLARSTVTDWVLPVSSRRGSMPDHVAARQPHREATKDTMAKSGVTGQHPAGGVLPAGIGRKDQYLESGARGPTVLCMTRSDMTSHGATAAPACPSQGIIMARSSVTGSHSAAALSCPTGPKSSVTGQQPTAAQTSPMAARGLARSNVTGQQQEGALSCPTEQNIRRKRALDRSALITQEPEQVALSGATLVTATAGLGKSTTSEWQPLRLTAPPKARRVGAFPDPAKQLVRRADEMRKQLLDDTGPLALKPTNVAAFLEAVTETYELMSSAFADSTQKQDRGSRWQWWCLLCADEAYGASPIRPYWDSRATAAEAARERYLYASAVPWILARMKPGPGRKVPKPSSAVNVLRGVRRILVGMDYEPPPMKVVNLVLRGILNRYLDEHGPEVLEVRRTEPIPFTAQLALVRLLRHTSGVRLLSKLTDNATSLFWCSVVAMACVHGQTGFRKAETTSPTRAFRKKDLARSGLTWLINGVVVHSPTRAQLLALRPLFDYAVLKPPPSKADQWGMVWGMKPIHLVYDPSQELSAAAALRDLELCFPIEGLLERKAVPLFMSDDKAPLTGPYMDRMIKAVMHHLGLHPYSWHSYRAALACSMLEAGATTAQILSVCRWQTEESLHTYATLSAAAYAELLTAAYGRDFTQVHPNDLPFAIGPEPVIRELRGFNMGEEDE